MDYLQAHREVEKELKAGTIKAFACGFNHERGRYIEVETEQGWNPNPVYQEIPATYDPIQDY